MNDINKLKGDIELKFGRKIGVPSVFDSLYLDIKKDTGKEVSVSTLKRIWGYVEYKNKPRYEILSTLSQYIGYKDWNDYVSSSLLSDFSDFLNDDVIESKKLKGGEIIKISWAPNRACVLKYLGESLYEVTFALNSKIIEGDKFSCSIIAKNEPLMCSSIIRNGRIIAQCYIAAKARGLDKVVIKQNP